MRSSFLSCVSLPALCLAGSVATLRAASYSEAEITRVQEVVKVLKAQVAPRSAKAGERILPVTTVSTGANSRAELRFPDNTLTRLGANSRFTLNGQGRTLDLVEGVIMVQVPKKQGGAKVRTAAVTAAVTGCSIIVEFHPNGIVKVMALELDGGRCVVSKTDDPSESQELHDGEMITTKDGAMTVPEGVPFDVAKFLASTKLVEKGDINFQLISDVAGVQRVLIQNGDLSKANYVIPGAGVTISLNNNTRNDLPNLQIFNQQNQPVVQPIINNPPPKPPKPPPPPPPPPPPTITTPPPSPDG